MERNPQIYGELLGLSLAGQALFGYAPAEERARRVLSKLRQTPRFIQSARDNIKDPPGIFVKGGLETLRGTLRFIESDLPRAFADVDDLGLLGDLADAQAEAIDAMKSYIAYLETDLAPRARASFQARRDRFAAKLRFEDASRFRSTACWKSAPRAQRGAGGVPRSRPAHRARRSPPGVAAHQGARRSRSTASSTPRAINWRGCPRSSRAAIW